MLLSSLKRRYACFDRQKMLKQRRGIISKNKEENIMYLKRITALLLTALLAFCSLGTFGPTAFAEKELPAKDDEPLTYIDENGNQATVPENAQITYITADNMPTYWDVANGWYVVSGTVDYNNTVIMINSVANLLLLDGAKLIFSDSNDYGFCISVGQALNVFAQSDSEEMGELKCTCFYDSLDGNRLGNITINGGKLTGRINGIDGSITINGGIIDVQGKCSNEKNLGFPAIGAAAGTGKIPDIIINGGTVIAKNHWTSWTGGSGTVYWQYGGCIGSYSFSDEGDMPASNTGTIIINGGTVITMCGNQSHPNYGTGFGTSGSWNDDSRISLVINGGTVVDYCDGNRVDNLTLGWTNYWDSIAINHIYCFGTISFTDPFVLQGTNTEVDESNFMYHTIVPPPLNVTFIIGKNTVYETQPVFYGQCAVEPEAPQSEGEHFVCWLYGDEPFDFSTPIVENTTLYALFDTNEDINYLVYDENGGATEAICDYYDFLTPDNTELSDFCYVVSEDITLSGRLEIGGEVDLIIMDGAALTAPEGITVPEGATLNVYGQSEGTGTLIATAVASGSAGIGGTKETACGTINIHGVVVNAQGASQNEPAAGIGGGCNMAGGVIRIYAGEVTATGGVYGNLAAAGIGGGDSGDGGDIAIYGGTVTATGGATASTYGGAGIGGGSSGAGGTIVISGGEVNATGGKNAAGIGGGDRANGGSITISGGNINASSGPNGKGIGAGRGANSASIELGWTDAHDSITSSAYNGTVSIVSDFMIRGTQTYATTANINGVTIVPCFTVTFESDENSILTVVASIPGGEDIEIESGAAVPALTVLHITAECAEHYVFIEQPEAEIIVTENVYFHTLTEFIPTYTVTFLDWDGTVISEQAVDSGSAAVAPADPERDGYVFVGWDTDFSNVTSNLTVTALYEVYIPPVTLLGDINCDGNVDSTDALIAMRYSMNLVNITAQGISNGDMNGDGAVNATDAVLIMRSVMQL